MPRTKKAIRDSPAKTRTEAPLKMDPLPEGISLSMPPMRRFLHVDRSLEEDSSDYARHTLRMALGSGNGFISAYRRWAMNPEDHSLALKVAIPIAYHFDYTAPLARLMRVDLREQSAHDLLSKRLARHLLEKGPSELAPAYRALIDAMEEEGQIKPIYLSLIRAYAGGLAHYQRFSEVCHFISRHVLPTVQVNGYLSARQVRSMLKGINGETLPPDPVLLSSVISHGFSEPDWSALQERLAGNDRAMKSLHDEIRSYARRIGLSETDVLADISIAYNGVPHARVDPSGGSLEVIAGSHTAAQIISGYSAWAFGHDESAIRVRSELEAEACMRASEILEGKLVIGGEYSSHLSPGNGWIADRELLREIADANRDIQTDIGFKLSHVQHGVMVLVLRLKADIEAIVSDPSSDGGRLDRFMLSIKSAIEGAR